MNVALLVNLLAPCLPFLMKLGDKAAEKAVEKAAEKVGEQSAEKAGKIWAKLWPKVEAKVAAKEAAADVAEAPEDEDSLTVLRVQLKKLLAADEGLAKEVEALLQEAQADAGGTWVQQSVQGNNNQVIGSMSGNAKAIGSVTGNVGM